MKLSLLNLLRCPGCESDLHLTQARETNGSVESGQLVCARCDQRYSIINFMPRFVFSDDSVDSFGYQWNRFRQTQLDSYSGLPISRERFFRQTGWSPDELTGKTVLDVGCGAGRFAEVALSCGADVVALDCSAAVDACWQNLGPHANLDIVQADIYHLPFKPGCFDFVYCFGVLQHTPDVKRAFMVLPHQLKIRGKLAVDVYPRLVRNILWPKYWLRLVTRQMPPGRLIRFTERLVDLLWPISQAVGRLPLVGRKLRYAIPIANYEDVYPLSFHQLKEWAILDTFDMLAPKHDHPQSLSTLSKWFHFAGLRDVKVFRSGLIVGRGVKRDPAKETSGSRLKSIEEAGCRA